MSISIPENKSMIKPSYTSSDIKNIYNGIEPDKGCDWRNPAYRVLIKVTSIMFVIWILYLGCAIYSGIIDKYINWIECLSNNLMNSILSNIIKEYIDLTKNSSALSVVFEIIAFLGMLLCLFIVYISALFPFTIFPIIIINKLYKRVKKNFIRQGRIHIPSISYYDYRYFLMLYENAEKLINYLQGSDIVDLFIENENTVRVVIHNSLISKEEKYVFKGMAQEIFTPTKIDFSIIDKQFDSVRKGNQSKKRRNKSE